MVAWSTRWVAMVSDSSTDSIWAASAGRRQAAKLFQWYTWLELKRFWMRWVWMIPWSLLNRGAIEDEGGSRSSQMAHNCCSSGGRSRLHENSHVPHEVHRCGLDVYCQNQPLKNSMIKMWIPSIQLNRIYLWGRSFLRQLNFFNTF